MDGLKEVSDTEEGVIHALKTDTFRNTDTLLYQVWAVISHSVAGNHKTSQHSSVIVTLSFF